MGTEDAQRNRGGRADGEDGRVLGQGTELLEGGARLDQTSVARLHHQPIALREGASVTQFHDHAHRAIAVVQARGGRKGRGVAPMLGRKSRAARTQPSAPNARMALHLCP